MNLIGKKYMLLFCWLLTAPKAVVSDVDMNHEKIHAAQMKELLYIPFYIWYVVEWIVRLFQYRDTHEAYKNISFEREAYVHEETKDYMKNRPIFNWRRFL